MSFVELPIVVSVKKGDSREMFGIIEDEEVISAWYGDGDDVEDLKAEESLVTEMGYFNPAQVSSVHPGRVSSLTFISCNGAKCLVAGNIEDVMRLLVTKETAWRP